MKTLYLDLPMGAAGDMLSAALYELLSDEEKKAFLEEINKAGIPGVTVNAEKSVKCGITGTHFKVLIEGEEEESHDAHEHEHHHHEEENCHEHEHSHDHEHEHHHDEEHCHEHDHHHDHEHGHHHHHHSSMAEIEGIINSLKIPDSVKKDIIEVYKLIAAAESNAHGVPVTDIHFHEVGTMDAIADITSVCLLMNKIGAAKICASAVNVGSGHVHCAHGILPVPAPATAFILKEVPLYSGHITEELCTPTGAALLKHFVSSFGNMPQLKITDIGYGMGKKDFEAANCVRAILGEGDEELEQILEYTCNLDDISAERIAFAMEQLFAAGAIEAYTIPVTMKKSRPGNLLCVMCRESDKDKILQTIFKHTTTLGVRENISRRYFLDRSIETVNTEFGDIRIKRAEGYGVKREKYEYEDLAAIARKTGLSIDEINNRLLRR
ncbi:nickel pincer cofactor biosynthesis protein LarC [Treponema bryantii]|uniref:nickel pincer cofactor biosynthesis protein LarC n=1 Tax=Treponema bryantii TaxID=163 RepID=UPI0003B5AFD7|nr:nickel pincer cofactor biosynthesis protein LarC [Treponema bryantii]